MLSLVWIIFQYLLIANEMEMEWNKAEEEIVACL